VVDDSARWLQPHPQALHNDCMGGWGLGQSMRRQ